ncbi:NAD(P)H-hydrate dehydratase [uncultured Paracoccus sp.]|uniref:NAD(P)H-hydrate dehydratase n=1 Tax=uncultured Paracoccus sp. TaxID=189685 RepID=UPI0025F581C0|nr:NAD(P)H-hydrate dehydratase [uncultured Paracoccus sp.]
MLPVTEVVTTAQMRAIESAAISGGHVTGLQLMERAGAGASRIILREYPRARTAVVLCGPGNNGGDGFVVARLLREAGLDVRVGVAAPLQDLPRDARDMCRRWLAHGPTHPMSVAFLTDRSFPPDIVVDAVFGTGLSRPPSGPLADVLAETTFLHTCIWKNAPAIIALDCPSGLDLDTGHPLTPGQPFMGASPIPLACLTITFHSLKPGHLLADGPDYCGRVEVVDIGLSVSPAGPLIRKVQPPSEFDLIKRPGHKYSHGHALILAGGPSHAGAARLAALSALRIGAGVVTLCPPDTSFAAAPPHALMIRPLPTAQDLNLALRDDRISALCAGPGLGIERAARMVPAILGSGRAAVLDADALTAFADHPPDLFKRLHDRVVLTPHLGEFARLFPDLAMRLSDDRRYSKLAAAQDAAQRAGATVLLKGPDTVIAAPGDTAPVSHKPTEIKIHRADDVPWLATAGAGDVLAGLITGLMARKMAPLDAAAHAVWLHAQAARAFGPGLIADDLPEMIPQVLRGLTP